MSMTKTWFITGASSGFGRALAEAALKRGDQVAICARRVAMLEATVDQAPERVLAVPLDVTNAEARNQAVAAARQRFGRIDVLANIAGRGSLGAAEEFPLEQLREQMELNFFSAAELTRAVLPIMREQRSGHILQLTSIGGIAAFQGFAPYCASKFALEGWSEALSAEVARFGIRVTIVEPGAFRTEFAGDKNMRPEQSIEAYRSVIGPIEKYLYGSDGKQPGDPQKAAAAMLQIVDSEKPPSRLLLGSDAIGLFKKKEQTLRDELERWQPIAEGTAFEGATTTPVGG